LSGIQALRQLEKQKRLEDDKHGRRSSLKDLGLKPAYASEVVSKLEHEDEEIHKVSHSIGGQS
jgi:hypothetical protein